MRIGRALEELDLLSPARGQAHNGQVYQEARQYERFAFHFHSFRDNASSAWAEFAAMGFIIHRMEIPNIV